MRSPPDRTDAAFNRDMARSFRQAADLLDAQGADLFRVRAYQRGADALEHLHEPASQIYRRDGLGGLMAIPAIGHALALAVAEVVELGRWRWLDRLRGAVEPETLLETVAGIGPTLAERVHEQLGIESLEELEVAAHNGRLATVEGFGAKRIQSVRDALGGRLRSRVGMSRPGGPPRLEPSVEDLIGIDAEYRTRVDRGDLAMIAPRRFNPTGASWLPILHTTRNAKHFTAMFSNTALAHELGRVHDWVVIYADPPENGQWTVVTETRGPHTGERVVRGR